MTAPGDERETNSLPTTHTNKASHTSSARPKHANPRYFYSPKFLLHVFIISIILLVLVQIQSLHQLPNFSSSSTTPHLSSYLKTSMPWKLISFQSDNIRQQQLDQDLDIMLEKLRRSVTFLPLKDLRYADTAHKGHTWFMSSMYDTQEEGEVQHQHFPSDSSHGRLLCLKGNDTHDGSWNHYALAWPEALPENATLLKGLTYVSYNHYDYGNIWHGLSALFPLAAWHVRNQCKVPSRWFLYHWGELRTRMSPWLNTLMEATYNGPIYIEGSTNNEWILERDRPYCFEEAVVTRHNEGGMARLRREQVFDQFRCKARIFCNVSLERRVVEVNKGGKKVPVIGMTMFMRNGGRSFKNDSVVIDVFKQACNKVEGCQLQVAYSDNLTFCQQVKLLSDTDVLVSPHGAQLTNMFFMDRNSSVLEFFPKGWLKLAGVGQYVYHWLASWSGMQHRGAWRDPDGPNCPLPKDDRNCMSFYKNAQIGHNKTHFEMWGKAVLEDVRAWKMEEFLGGKDRDAGCACTPPPPRGQTILIN